MLRLAQSDIAGGDTDNALTRLNGWLDQHGDDVGVRLLVAESLLRDHPDQAIAHYEQLSESGNPVALNNLAWLYMQRHDARAVKVAQRAVDLAPEDADVLDTLGWVTLQQQGDADAAVTALRRSIELNPDNPSVQYHLGMALRDSGDIAGARLALSRALEDGSFPEADDARAALEAFQPAAEPARPAPEQRAYKDRKSSPQPAHGAAAPAFAEWPDRSRGCPMGHQNRHHESPRTWFRCERFFRSNEQWYFHTREGIAVGPYRSRFEAEVDAGVLMAKLRDTATEHSQRVIRDFLLTSGGDLDYVNDPAFTSYVTQEGREALWEEGAR